MASGRYGFVLLSIGFKFTAHENLKLPRISWPENVG